MKAYFWSRTEGKRVKWIWRVLLGGALLPMQSKHEERVWTISNTKRASENRHYNFGARKWGFWRNPCSIPNKGWGADQSREQGTKNPQCTHHSITLKLNQRGILGSAYFTDASENPLFLSLSWRKPFLKNDFLVSSWQLNCFVIQLFAGTHRTCQRAML